MNQTTYLIRSVQFWHAARISVEHEPDRYILGDVVWHLLSHCTELALKSYLMDVLSTNQFKSLSNSHGIKDLMLRSIEEGLEIDVREVGALMLFDNPHKTHIFRYGQKGSSGSYTAPDYPVALLSTARLIDRISGNIAVLRNGYGGDLWVYDYPAPDAIQMKAVPSMILAMTPGEERIP